LVTYQVFKNVALNRKGHGMDCGKLPIFCDSFFVIISNKCAQNIFLRSSCTNAWELREKIVCFFSVFEIFIYFYSLA
jgi:hypothetical protein